MAAGSIAKDLELLFVEDDLIVREDVASVLRKSYPSLLLARDGVEGLDIFEKRRPDIVISDIRMPGMDGLEMARRIREIQNDSVLIMTSAYSDEDTLLTSIDIGVTRFIKKPLHFPELLETIERTGQALNKARLHRERQELARRVTEENPSFLLLVEDGELRYANQSILSFLGIDPADRRALEKAAETLVHALGRTAGDELPEDFRLQDFLAVAASEPGRERLLGLTPRNSRRAHARPARYAPHDGRASEGIYLCRVRRLSKGTGGDGGRTLVNLFDVTAMENEKRRYFELSTRDPLTGAHNRLFFRERLAQEMDRAVRFGLPLSMIMLDIDNFKHINDAYGHQTGDYVLTELVRLLRGSIRSIDLLSRYGGEEFLILAPQTGLLGSLSSAQKLLTIIAGHDFSIDAGVTCSFGVAELRPGETSDQFLRRADMALYRAKSQGRNRITAASGHDVAAGPAAPFTAFVSKG